MELDLLKIFQESAEHIAMHLLATFNEIHDLNAAYNVANKHVAICSALFWKIL